VLGKIVHTEPHVATDQSQRLCLKPGADYVRVTVAALPFE
jgi:hypothetical protein